MEILTNQGWKPLQSIQSDNICVVDPKSFKAKFLPAKTEISAYSGKSVFIEHDKIRQHVPLNSNVVIVGKGLVPVNSILNTENGFANSCLKEDGKSLKDNYSKLLGFYIGDGTVVDGSTGFIRFHLKKPRKVKYLKSLGYDIEDKSGHSYILRKSNIGNFFREQMYTEDKLKKFPDDFLSFSAPSLENILDGLRNSDGENVKEDNTFQLTTESERVASELSTICALLGYDAGYSSVKDKYYLVTSSPGKPHPITLKKFAKIKKVNTKSFNLGYDAVLCKKDNIISVCSGNNLIL